MRADAWPCSTGETGRITLHDDMDAQLFLALAEAARSQRPVALGILTGVKGSSPQKVGAKALFRPDRTIQGTLGGGCLEAEVQRLALTALNDAQPKTFEFVLDHDFGWDDGLICGGKVSGVIIPNAQNAGETFWARLAARETELTWGVRSDFSVALLADGPNETSAAPSLQPSPPLQAGERENVNPARRAWLYTESLTPPCALWIAGSGHIAQAVAPLAIQLDFAVTVFDDRPELANHSFFPGEIQLRLGPWGELVAAPLPATPTFGLIVTRGHQHDALVLETWIHRPFAFLGMIGSSRKARTIKEHFLARQLATSEELARVACPVGICIRSRSVMEIAVDILAQYIDRRAAVLTEKGAALPAKLDVTQ